LQRKQYRSINSKSQKQEVVEQTVYPLTGRNLSATTVSFQKQKSNARIVRANTLSADGTRPHKQYRSINIKVKNKSFPSQHFIRGQVTFWLFMTFLTRIRLNRERALPVETNHGYYSLSKYAPALALDRLARRSALFFYLA
jgi:hypothetical protein